jgi:hypothetical protein
MSKPAGWIAAGMAPQDYEFTTDLTEHHSGTRSGKVSARRAPTGFATLMQQVLPDDYLGHRVRLRGWVKTEQVTGWCGLWMRIDGSDKKRWLGFDNMGSRPIVGTTAWASHEVVLDVPPEATLIAFGLILDGAGAAWLDDVTLEIVGNDVATTGEPAYQTPRQPRNLSFEE